MSALTLRQQLGAIVHDWPPFLRHIVGDWKLVHNRREVIARDGRGVECQWEFTSDLHIARVFPLAGRLLLRRAIRDWPLALCDEPLKASDRPMVSFLIGHRGLDRLPHLLATLRSIAGQKEVAIECVVIEQSAQREVPDQIPRWVRYLHTPVDPEREYCRSATFNAGARIARGEVLVLHDNDMLVPERYAAEIAARVGDGWRFADPKRFIFYVGEQHTAEFFRRGALRSDTTATIVQNLRGGSVGVKRDAFFDIGGFDEEFVGWGGEDLDFWERAVAHGGTYAFGYLPVLHLWHRPQKDKARRDAPAMRRYDEIRDIPPAERTRRLRALRSNP